MVLIKLLEVALLVWRVPATCFPRRGGGALRPGLSGLCSLLLVSCASSDPKLLAERYDLRSVQVAGAPFQHQVFVNQQPGDLLHVYIEGDGRPWRTRNRISQDPTPDKPLMLELMALDPAPGVYLGRPCYFGLPDAECSPLWWTQRRYSAQVVQSLDRVLDRFAVGYRGLVLFGHSGGGTLAMLRAGRRADVKAVVTLAGNLDIDAWAELHGYTPLEGSLNPARQPPLPGSIRQLHLVGERDTVIPAALLSGVLEGQPSAEMRVVAGANHVCCWQSLWPQLPTALSSDVAAPTGG